MSGIKIGIIDDSLFVIKILSVFFNSSVNPTFEVLFELDSCDYFPLFKLFPTAPQVVILDVDMPGIKGVEGITLLLNRFPNCRIIVFTEQEDKDIVMKCIQAGASGYLKKNTRRDELIYAIKTVLSGKLYITPVMIIEMTNYLQCKRESLIALTK